MDGKYNIEDNDLTIRAQVASRIAIEILKLKKCPKATCDPEKGTVYMLQPDGNRTDEIKMRKWNENR